MMSFNFQAATTSIEEVVKLARALKTFKPHTFTCKFQGEAKDANGVPFPVVPASGIEVDTSLLHTDTAWVDRIQVRVYDGEWTTVWPQEPYTLRIEARRFK